MSYPFYPGLNVLYAYSRMIRGTGGISRGYSSRKEKKKKRNEILKRVPDAQRPLKGFYIHELLFSFPPVEGQGMRFPRKRRTASVHREWHLAASLPLPSTLFTFLFAFATLIQRTATPLSEEPSSVWFTHIHRHR